MSVNEKTSAERVRVRPRIDSQYTAKIGPSIEVNDLPSETVPEQGLSIQEIIARYVRTGTMPVAVHDDNGGNSAFEPEFDPLDQSPEQIRRIVKEGPPKPSQVEDKPESEPDPAAGE